MTTLLINPIPKICNFNEENKSLSLSKQVFDKLDKLITLSSYHIIISLGNDNDKGYLGVIR